MSKRIVSGYKGSVAIALMALFTLIGGYVLHEDLTNDGLTRAQAYLVLGPLIYPVFYSAVVWTVFRFALLYRRRHEFLTVGDGSIRLNRRVVPLDDVLNVEVKRNWLGLKMLRLHRNEGSDIRLLSYVLTRPVDDVVTELRANLGHSNSTMT
jgi:uncharacterized membrane protein